MDASSTSKGPGAVVASPSIRILGPYGRPAWNSRPPTHSTSIAAACGTVADCDFDIRFNPTPLRPCPMPSTILEHLLSLVGLDLEFIMAPSSAGCGPRIGHSRKPAFDPEPVAHKPVSCSSRYLSV